MRKIIVTILMFLIMILISGIDALSQQKYTVSGYVVDEASVGVRGIMMSLYNSSFSFSTSTITSDSGYYEFTDVPSGENYRISAFYLPYEDVDITTNPSSLEFGEVEIGQSKALPLEINVSPSIIKMRTITPNSIEIISLSSDLENQNFTMLALPDMPPYVVVASFYQWIIIEPISFVGDNETVDVTVDNSILNEKKGNHSGIIDIYVAGSTTSAQVTVNVTATCILSKPNPYNPTTGNLTFFGDGIVPGETTIEIYTLSGELVKELDNVAVPFMAQRLINQTATRENEITWDGKNEDGDTVTNGIYIYTYESPREKGVGKFTVIRK